ncbi:large ribosomal subunit protein mL63 [Periplaneta americana]|uniref:large ribosomal subunit protein mL63 n=1 Tax=Periplaneta americana TaxID=6978 RepID=UPI0037E7E40D
MRLALLLFSRKGPPGHIWRGKRKLLKEVTPLARNNLRNDYVREEENMFYLRHPYLTIEQSCGHAAALNKKEEWLDNFRRIRLKQKPHFTMEEQYSHLKVKDAWE